MQCNSCGSKWESNNIVTTCPFCGANLAKAKDPNNMDISDAIESIIANQGIEVLNNTRLVNAHVMDLVRGHDRDKKLFRILCTNGAMEFAYKIAKTTDSSQKEVIIKKQIKVLVDDAFLAEDNAIAAINIILRGLGEKEIQAIQSASAQVIQSVTNSSMVKVVKLSTVNNSVQSASARTVVHPNINSEEKQYIAACKVKEEAFKNKDISKLEHTINLFSLVDTYKDSADLMALCEEEIQTIKYENAIKEKQSVYSYRDVDGIERTLNKAIAIFNSLNSYRDSAKQVAECEELKKSRIYEIAVDTKDTADKYSDETIYSKAVMMFGKIKDYKDSEEQAKYCSQKLDVIHKETVYKKALYYYEKTDAFSLETAISWFEKVIDWKDSRKLCEDCKKRLVKAKAEKEKQNLINEQEYNRALTLLKKNDVASVKKAIEILDRIPTWKDSRTLSERYKRALNTQINTQTNYYSKNTTRQQTTTQYNNSQSITSQRKQQGLCQYCGGSLKGLFIKKCSKCGKTKDY